MLKVGGVRGGVSMAWGIGFDVDVSVSPTVIESGTPDRVTISPTEATGGMSGVRLTPRLTNTPVMVDVEDAVVGCACDVELVVLVGYSVDLGITVTDSFFWMIPESIRPVHNLPRKGS